MASPDSLSFVSLPAISVVQAVAIMIFLLVVGNCCGCLAILFATIFVAPLWAWLIDPVTGLPTLDPRQAAAVAQVA